VASVDVEVVDVDARCFGDPQPVQRQQIRQRVVPAAREAGLDEERAELVGVKPERGGLVVLLRPPYVGGRVAVDVGLARAERLAGDYVGRFGTLELRLRDSVLGIQSGDEFRPLTFTSDTDACAGSQDRYRFVLAPDGRPSYVVILNGGRTWDYNGGPADGPGPDKPEWQPVLGEYTVKIAGNPIASSQIMVQNGYLYVTVMGTALRLEEHQSGLFFTSTGEALDLRDKMTFAGVFELEQASL